MNIDVQPRARQVDADSLDSRQTKIIPKGLHTFSDLLAFNYRPNYVNIYYIGITHLLALLSILLLINISKDLCLDMLVYVAIHVSMAIISITAYTHRLISHSATRSVSPLIHLLFGYIGQTLSAQGSIASWAGKHRVHHAVDGHQRHDEDPYSAEWFISAWRNFLWSHMLCYFFYSPHEDHLYQKRTDSVLKQHPVLQIQHQYYVLFLTIFTHVSPFIIGVVIGKSIWVGLGYLCCSALAVVIAHHITWSVNSVTHMWGVQAARSSARNNYIWLLPLGEGNHHADHHDAPTDYRNGFGWLGWLLDPTRYMILLFRFMRLIGPIHRTSTAIELRIRSDRKLRKLTRAKTYFKSHETMEHTLVLDEAFARASELWTYYEESLFEIKKTIYQRAQRLDKVKKEIADLAHNHSQLTRTQVKERLIELRSQLALAKRELKVEWQRFKLELKEAKAALIIAQPI